jgi:ferredoxin
VLLKYYRRLLGPTIAEGSLAYSRIESSSDLPVGVSDRQEAGRYRLTRSDRPTLFDYVVGQHSWKQFLHPPEEALWNAARSDRSFTLTAHDTAAESQAFIGVRPCELAALEILDIVLTQGPFADTSYRRRRDNTFVVAVNCTRPGGTCFCASMNTGPRATRGFDLALTELCDDSDHCFVMEIGSERGAEVASELPVKPADEFQLKSVAELVSKARSSMGRELDTTGLRELLYDHFDNPIWEETARRCLSCANCTMVCPTCFCTTTSDSTDLTGGRAERRRRWDSCFSLDFSYIHGGCIRVSTSARYRQWLTHKLGYWQDQFGMIGCVGCGRCITWCPAAIDITEEARSFREGG